MAKRAEKHVELHLDLFADQWDAYVEWCAANEVDPVSLLETQALSVVVRMGKRWCETGGPIRG
jgi:hypothetical protein